MLLLKDQWLLAQVEEIDGAQFGDPDCILVNPMSIEGNDLKDWLPFADSKETVVRSSDIPVSYTHLTLPTKRIV